MSRWAILPSATISMTFAFAALAIAAFAPPAVAANPGDTDVMKVLRCRPLSDAALRLACFDREAAAIQSSTPHSAAAAPDVSAKVLAPEQQFGMTERAVASKEVAAGIRAADATKIVARVTQLSASANGRLVVALENDQVWRQLIADGELLLHTGDSVTISRAALGSFWMKTPSGRGCKVTRVR